MAINPYKMRKDELITFFFKTCKHGHKYAAHPQCYINECNKAEKVGYLDIETNGFFANFHIMLSYAIKVEGENKIYGRSITREELHGNDFDKQLLKDCVNDLLKFDRIITFNGTIFDIPFLRTRCLKLGVEDFPLYGLVKHTDVYFMAKSKLRMHRKTMEECARLLKVPGKNHVDGDIWLKAYIHGDKKSLKDVFEHNKKDVEVLEPVYQQLRVYSLENRRSL